MRASTVLSICLNSYAYVEHTASMLSNQGRRRGESARFPRMWPPFQGLLQILFFFLQKKPTLTKSNPTPVGHHNKPGLNLVLPSLNTLILVQSLEV